MGLGGLMDSAGVATILGKVGVTDPSKVSGVVGKLTGFLQTTLKKNPELLDKVFAAVPFLKDSKEGGGGGGCAGMMIRR